MKSNSKISKFTSATIYLGFLFSSIRSFVRGVITNNIFEIISGTIASFNNLADSVGLGGFISKIRDNKLFNKIANGVEFFLPKPIRALIPICLGVFTAITSPGLLPFVELSASVCCLSYSVYNDIKCFKKTQLKIFELSCAKKKIN